MTLSLSPAGVTALLAEPPDMCQLWFRPANGGRWRKVMSGTQQECTNAMNGPGDWWFKTRIEAEEDLGLFADENASGEQPEALNANASRTA